MSDPHGSQPNSPELGRRSCRGERAFLGVGAAPSRQVEVGYIGLRGQAESVKQQRVGIGQAEPAAEEDGDEEPRPDTKASTDHANSLDDGLTDVHSNKSVGVTKYDNVPTPSRRVGTQSRLL